MICDEEETTGSGSLDGWVGTGFSSHLRVGWNVPIGDFFFPRSVAFVYLISRFTRNL